ncbi:MAG: DUF4268 domain-containing protein [Candidatus Paceibacterota bacterium]
MEKLGKLHRVDLRKAWNHEAHHFTQWLSEEDNLAILGDEIGIDIKLIQTEASVGRFNVDIFAEEQNTGRKIIIENQLEPTNHDHLGKLITYASGLDAEIVVWIVEEVRDEHKQAMDWLNEHTDEDIYFFAIKMELWQIGDSPFAPKFQAVSKPNDWAKAVKTSVNRGPLTDTKMMQLDFWNKFVEFTKRNGTTLKLRKTGPQHWFSISLGNSISHLALTLNTQDSQMACEMYIPDNKELFDNLYSQKDKINTEINKDLKWQRLDGKKASRIRLSNDADFNDKDHWDEYFTWLKDTAELFLKVFPKYIKKTAEAN